MGVWEFYDYIEDSGQNPFFDWQSGLDEGAKAKIDTRILQMAGMEKWQEKWVSKYKGTYKILELRIPHNKVQYRPLGMYASERKFILLAGAVEKGDKLLPKNIIKTAVRRQKNYQKGIGSVGKHKFN